ncbi:serine protease 57-like [Chionomys nivalis]|uniref:serine protease 57-like n=1 Tax=Chionomys nivalis TaxID=269649 RepID=UPI0025964881|nr:serine protease 57-like [Chionomys nivalis]
MGKLRPRAEVLTRGCLAMDTRKCLLYALTTDHSSLPIPSWSYFWGWIIGTSSTVVVPGAHALLRLEPTRQVLSNAAVIQHPGYQPATRGSDICLLRQSWLMELNVCNSSWRGQLNSAVLCTHSGDRQWCGFCFYDGLLCEGTEATKGADSGGPFLVCGSRAHGLVSFSGLRMSILRCLRWWPGMWF